MALPLSNRLRKLKNYWSVSINMQFKMIFRFENERASEVAIVDYH